MGGARFGLFAALLVVASCICGVALGGTTGKLSGRVVDAKKQPLMGVNVAVIGMPLGGQTDADGKFTIINIPSGKISVKASLIGYGVITTQNIEINADNTTRLDLELKESAVQMQEVVVSAHRAVIDVNRTSNIATVSRQQLQALPVQELQDVVNLQAGVVDGHFRGGRSGEVQYQVDGVSVNNAYDNKSTLKLDRSLLEEVQVVSGTFDAEYGQAMSGVVNAILKRGGDKFEWDGEVFSGGPVYSPSAGRIVDAKTRPFSQQNFQMSVNGPTRLPKTTFLLSGRHYVDQNWVRGVRAFNPTDRLDTLRSALTGRDSVILLRATGDGRSVPLRTSREWSGVLKLTNRSIPNVELSYQAIVDYTKGEGSTTPSQNWLFRYDPLGQTNQRTLSVVQGMDLTHTLSPTRFYTLSARQNYFDYHDWTYENIFDPRYDAAGAPFGFPDFENGVYIRGVDLTRFKQHTNGAVLKGSFVDQQSRDHQFKVGGEFQAPHVQFGSPGYLSFGDDTLTASPAPVVLRRTAYDAKFPGVVEYRPFIGAAFAQEEIEWNDLTIRGGVRAEYFNPRTSLPSDLANPANSITGVPKSHLERLRSKYSVAPRLGVSYPVSKTTSLFFAYGHFYQFPGLGDIYRNADYNQLQDLQAGLATAVMGNPDIRPEKTVQYQFGYKQNVSEDLGLDVTMFYKDIRDLLGTRIIETYNGAQYAQLSNVDFGNVIGFTISVKKRSKGSFSSTLDYTWQSAQGDESDPQETFNLLTAGKDAEPKSLPFNWDQRHTVNLTLVMSRPGLYSMSSIIRASSGQPYTPEISTGAGGGLETNSGRKPTTLVVDLRGDRTVNYRGMPPVSLFARVFNVFDTRFDNGFVFPSTGDPYYSRFPVENKGTLADPTRFFGPRRIEAGLTLNVGK